MLPPKELVLFKNGNAEKCRKMPKNAENMFVQIATSYAAN